MIEALQLLGLLAGIGAILGALCLAVTWNKPIKHPNRYDGPFA